MTYKEKIEKEVRAMLEAKASDDSIVGFVIDAVTESWKNGIAAGAKRARSGNKPETKREA